MLIEISSAEERSGNGARHDVVLRAGRQSRGLDEKNEQKTKGEAAPGRSLLSLVSRMWGTAGTVRVLLWLAIDWQALVQRAAA
jgi:hypothetical protein